MDVWDEATVNNSHYDYGLYGGGESLHVEKRERIEGLNSDHKWVQYDLRGEETKRLYSLNNTRMLKEKEVTTDEFEQASNATPSKSLRRVLDRFSGHLIRKVT